MGIRTGAEFIARLRDTREVWLGSERDRQELLKEARCIAQLYWNGWDAMLQ
jgi:aromatic ring hydroxylase